jgi:hypothetical protein
LHHAARILKIWAPCVEAEDDQSVDLVVIGDGETQGGAENRETAEHDQDGQIPPPAGAERTEKIEYASKHEGILRQRGDVRAEQAEDMPKGGRKNAHSERRPKGVVDASYIVTDG